MTAIRRKDTILEHQGAFAMSRRANPTTSVRIAIRAISTSAAVMLVGAALGSSAATAADGSGLGWSVPGLEFAAVAGQALTQTVDLRNVGTTVLDGVTVGIGDDAAGAFTVDPTTCPALDPGAGCSLAVRFEAPPDVLEPTENSATLQAEATDPDGLTVPTSLWLSGLALPPPRHEASLSPVEVRFPAVPAGSGPQTTQVSVVNEGDLDVVVTTAEVVTPGGDGTETGETPSSAFSVAPLEPCTTLPATITAAGSCPLELTWTPGDVGTVADLLRVGVEGLPALEAAVSAIVRLPVDTWWSPGVSAATVDVGTVPIHRNARTLVLTTTPSQDWTPDLAVSPDDAGLEVRAQRTSLGTWSLLLVPHRPGPIDAVATIPDDVGEPATVHVLGTAVLPPLLVAATPSALAFGAVAVGDVVQRSVRLDNTTDQPLGPATVTITGPGAAALQTVTDCPDVLYPVGMSAFGPTWCTATITTRPTVPGPGAATVTVAFPTLWLSPPRVATATITVTGRATPPKVVLGATTVDTPDPAYRWGRVRYTVTVRNTSANPADDVLLAFAPSAGLTPLALTSPQGDCVLTAPPRCDLGRVGPTSTVKVLLTAKATRLGLATLAANLTTSSYDPVRTNNAPVAVTTVLARPVGATPR